MISEIDIKDMTELYKLERGDLFYFTDADDIKTPPDAPHIDPFAIWKFLGVDGMYAKITTGNGLHYAAAWSKVSKVAE